MSVLLGVYIGIAALIAFMSTVLAVSFHEDGDTAEARRLTRIALLAPVWPGLLGYLLFRIIRFAFTKEDA